MHFKRQMNFAIKKLLDQKKRFDKTTKCSKLLPGDLVLVRRKGFTMKHKIADKWETEPYEIVSQRSDGLLVYTVVRDDRERTLHHNMLFPLGIRHDTESILDDFSGSESKEVPGDQVDNSSNDGEVDQPIYEGPQTWSHTRKLLKANLLIDQLFDLEDSKICDDVEDIVNWDKKSTESIKDLILQFWYQQLHFTYTVCCDLAETGTCPINC